MPVFASLPWINVWALADEGGWTIVDCGIHSPETVQAWQEAFAGSLSARGVARVLATHLHPDHCGMAGWLADRFQVRLWMTRLEYFSCRIMAADTGRCAPPPATEFYAGAGWDESAIDRYRQKFGSFGQYIYPLPESFRRIVDGEILVIGPNEWTVVVGSGHSPEHACLYCPALKLADLRRSSAAQDLLERVGVPHRTRRQSAGGLAQFPGRHRGAGAGRRSGAARAQQSVHRPARAHSQAHPVPSGRSRPPGGTAGRPKRVIDVFPALFGRPITPELLGMATGEALAHLNYLLAGGRALRQQDGRGVWVVAAALAAPRGISRACGVVSAAAF